MKGTPMAARNRTTGWASVAGLSLLALLAAACGGGEGAGAAADVSARPPQDQILVSSADAATPFELQAGRYKFGWDASACDKVAFTLTGAAQGFTYEKTTLQKKFSSIVSDVPADTYTIAQTEAACATWSVQIDRISD